MTVIRQTSPKEPPVIFWIVNTFAFRYAPCGRKVFGGLHRLAALGYGYPGQPPAVPSQESEASFLWFILHRLATFGPSSKDSHVNQNENWNGSHLCHNIFRAHGQEKHKPLAPGRMQALEEGCQSQPPDSALSLPAPWQVQFNG